ncbi:Phosphodiesterase [Durusdinium trenchii]|uniref:Phosphodiesterase n=1 Tax=Durusdinium trenchii TaxID=1381693 RepID=A0ABP0KQ29_9DINO
MALGALVCWGSWSVTLVLATKAGMPFQSLGLVAKEDESMSLYVLYYVNFTIAFLCTGFLVGFLGGSLGSGGEAYDFHTPFIDEISGYLWGISGGIAAWTAGIGMMGNAIGFPLCVGLGMVTGAIVAYVQVPCCIYRILPTGFSSTCMSVVSEDEEVVDLSLQLSSLRVSVSGPSSLAFEALRRVSEWFRGIRGGNPPSSNSSDHFTVVTTPRPSSGPSASRPTTTRASIEASFPEVPAGLLLSGRRLSGSELSGEERIRRAWRAGCWARAVLSGRVATPSASVQLNLRPRIYVVLRTPRLAAPACSRRRLPRDSAVMADVEEDEFQGAGVGLDFKDLVPLSVSLVPYVVLWPSDLQQGADLESLFLIVIKRAGGLIGALPLGVISDREIASGSSEANPHALLGASTTIMVPGVYQNSQGVWEPSESEVALLVADFTSDVAQLLRPMTEDDTESFPFVTDHIEIFPEPSHVVSQVMEWLATQGLSVPEGPYQSDAQEVTAQSGGATPPAKSSTPRRQVGPKGATSSVKPSPKPKRVTTAALAESLEGVLSSLPALSSQIETLVAKQEVLERQLESSEDPTACAYGSAVDTGGGRGGGLVHMTKSGTSPALRLLDEKVNFAQWAMALPRLVLASRTDLAWHLRASFSVRTRVGCSLSTVFPLPLPYVGVFDGGGPGLSKVRLRTLAQKRLLNLVVLVLNKLYLGRFASVAELGRPPSAAQLKVFDRLYGYITVCGSRLEDFSVAPGRSGPELIACIARLEAFLAIHPALQGGYFDHGAIAYKPPTLSVEERFMGTRAFEMWKAELFGRKALTREDKGAPLAPQTGNERSRALARAATQLIPDRAVTTETRDRRAIYLKEFDAWLTEAMDLSVDVLLAEKPADPEKISECLVQYGRALFTAGKSYQKYSETINAVGTARPLIKRQLTRAWDLAFAWLQDEPHSHHPALPASILLSMLSTALIWGWKREAALWAMGWSGIMRVGEMLMTRRSDLILPSDAAPGFTHILVKIHQPKTRGRGAKHQAARVDQEDLVRLIAGAFKDEAADALLWPLSASTLRKRFGAVLKELGLPTRREGEQRPYELASLRAGGDFKSNLAFLIPGVIVALMAICTVGFLSYRKEKEVYRRQGSGTSDESSEDGRETSGETSGTAESGPEQIDVQADTLVRKLVVCILGGLLLGFSNIGMGFFFFNLGNKSMNLTVSYCIGQSAPLVGILWGTFFFKEFAGTSEKVWGLVPVVCFLFAGAIVLIAAPWSRISGPVWSSV